MRSRQYRLEGGRWGEEWTDRGEACARLGLPVHERRTHGSGRRLGAHRDADLAQILSVPSLSGGKKPVPPPKMVSENAQIAPGDASTRGRFANRPDACRTKEKLASVSKDWVGCSPVCLGEGGCVCGKVSRLAARKWSFRGPERLSRPRTLLRLRSGDGSRSVWSSVGKIRFSRFGFGSRETLDEGSISHVRSRAKKFQRPRLFCNSRPQAARCQSARRADGRAPGGGVARDLFERGGRIEANEARDWK